MLFRSRLWSGACERNPCGQDEITALCLSLIHIYYINSKFHFCMAFTRCWDLTTARRRPGLYGTLYPIIRLIPVSYTHLSRVVYELDPSYWMNEQRSGSTQIFFYQEFPPVSYTHLDVYKRQIHDTVHEMAKDEARHGKAFEGLLNRYFG